MPTGKNQDQVCPATCPRPFDWPQMPANDLAQRQPLDGAGALGSTAARPACSCGFQQRPRTKKALAGAQ